jgi:hypothetical protein
MTNQRYGPEFNGQELAQLTDRFLVERSLLAGTNRSSDKLLND